MAAAKKSGLGRGLDALFADAVPVIDTADTEESKKTPKKTNTKKAAGDEVQYVKIHDIMPNLNQPRKTFQEEKIEDWPHPSKSTGSSSRSSSVNVKTDMRSLPVKEGGELPEKQNSLRFLVWSEN